MRCPNCGRDLTGRALRARFCPGCGVPQGNPQTPGSELATRPGSRPLTPEVIVGNLSETLCDNCGQKVAASATSCDHCGMKFTSSPPPGHDAAWYKRAAKAPSQKVSTGHGPPKPAWSEASREWRATCPVCKATHVSSDFKCSTCKKPSLWFVLECHESWMHQVKITKFTVYLQCPDEEEITSSLTCPSCKGFSIKMRNVEVYRKSDHDVYANLLRLGGFAMGFVILILAAFLSDMISANRETTGWIDIGSIVVSYILYKIAYKYIPRPKKWIAYVG